MIYQDFEAKVHSIYNVMLHLLGFKSLLQISFFDRNCEFESLPYQISEINLKLKQGEMRVDYV